MSIAGGSDLGLFEIHNAATLVQEAAHEDANIIFGTVIDDSLGDEVRVTVIAAGFDSTPSVVPPTMDRRLARAADNAPQTERIPAYSPPPPSAPSGGETGGYPAQQPYVPREQPTAPPSQHLPHSPRPLDDDDDDVDVPPFMKR